jgi:hypothetical protein
VVLRQRDADFSKSVFPLYSLSFPCVGRLNSLTSYTDMLLADSDFIYWGKHPQYTYKYSVCVSLHSYGVFITCSRDGSSFAILSKSMANLAITRKIPLSLHNHFFCISGNIQGITKQFALNKQNFDNNVIKKQIQKNVKTQEIWYPCFLHCFSTFYFSEEMMFLSLFPR